MIEECGAIARGDGSVVTGRFTTSRVDAIARLTVRNEFGLSESVEGTLIHPIWSVDRNDWVSISDLEPGERLQGAEGILYVESIDLVRRKVSVYNIEVHGEHVYQVGELGLLVHNTCTVIGRMDDLRMFDDVPAELIDTWRKTGLGDQVSWFQNKQWILDRVARGDTFFLATDPSTLPKLVGGFVKGRADGYFTAKELDLLKRLGVEVWEIWE